MSPWREPSGRRAAFLALAALAGLAISNVSATVFWHAAGGVGILDLDGGANLLQPGSRVPLPPAGTAARITAILAAYSPHIAAYHAVLLCTLDLLLPPLLAVTGWMAVAAASRPWRPTARRTVRAIGAILAVGYLCSDWGENTIELLLLSGTRGHLVDALLVASSLKLATIAALALFALGCTAVAAVYRGTNPGRLSRQRR